ncbi:MAG: metallopeptidase family protein [Endomicrobiales bacterium]
MTLEEFERTIEDSLSALPPEFREILSRQEIQVLARDRVPRPLKKRYRGDIFGVFVGEPFGGSVSVQPVEPTRIELYRESFERAFDDAAEIKRQILITVVHEVGHYFGFSEKQLRKLGY